MEQTCTAAAWRADTTACQGRNLPGANRPSGLSTHNGLALFAEEVDQALCVRPAAPAHPPPSLPDVATINQ
jgi:hypothetical protein